MSAYGTKKPGSDLTIQLGFPTNFQDAYADMGPAKAFAPSSVFVAEPFPSGDDVLDQYHHQKMMDAHRRTLTAVADTRRSVNRALVSHAGYYNMPPAVLGQRIYANPSFGSGSADIYKPITRETPGLTGGVLRSRAGQTFAQGLLQARIAQLNAIDEASAGLETGVPMTDLSITQGLSEVVAPGALVKLTSLLNNLNNALSGGVSSLTRFESNDLTELMLLLFRVAPQTNYEELENILEALDLASEKAQEALLDLREVRPEEGAPGADAPVSIYRIRKVRNAEQWFVTDARGTRVQGPFGSEEESTAVADELNRRGLPLRDRQYQNNWAATIASSIPLLREYVARQFRAINMSPADRIALSRNSVRDLGLTRFRAAVQSRADATNAYARYAQLGRSGIIETAEVPSTPVGLSGQGTGGRAMARGMSSMFTEQAMTREDQEQLGNRARFNIDERQVFGDNSGRFYGSTYENAAPLGNDVGRISSAAAMGVRNPFRAPAAAVEERSRRDFEQTATREPDQVVGQGRRRKTRGGSEASKKKVLGKMEKDLGVSDELKRLFEESKAAATKRKPSERPADLAMPGGEGKKPRIQKGPTPPKGMGKQRKPRLLNSAGKVHRGPFHIMPDGAYHSGAKHTARSKVLTVAQ